MPAAGPFCGESGALFWSDVATRSIISGIGVYFIIHG